MNIPVFAAVGLAIVSMTTLASSQPRQPYRTTERTSSTSTYQVEFIDDPLSAMDSGAYVARVRVRPGRVRTLLLRPRTSFVQDMLKSVESSD